MHYKSQDNTLVYNTKLCINCGMCLSVCPHAVFIAGNQSVDIAHHEACMECGACQRNCPTGAITVDNGVGCATAMIYAALRGDKEVKCGTNKQQSCC